MTENEKENKNETEKETEKETDKVSGRLVFLAFRFWFCVFV